MITSTPTKHDYEVTNNKHDYYQLYYYHYNYFYHDDYDNNQNDGCNH